MVNSNASKRRVLITIFPPPADHHDKPVTIPIENLKIVSLPFGTTLFGRFMWIHISFPKANHKIHEVWNKFGLQDVFMNNQHYYFFKFSLEQGLRQVMEEGPWSVYESPLSLQRWRPGLVLNKTNCIMPPVVTALVVSSINPPDSSSKTHPADPSPSSRKGFSIYDFDQEDLSGNNRFDILNSIDDSFTMLYDETSTAHPIEKLHQSSSRPCDPSNPIPIKILMSPLLVLNPWLTSLFLIRI
ncbi:hypothetical protein L1887_38820 [Cichorium endivia]|nr:hypothetical protein L1887_38820 [Cichorium endivia]